MAKPRAGKRFTTMANGMSVNKVSYFARVNQRLLQARFLLQQARSLSKDFLPPLQHDALTNSVLLHLQLALVFYWRELADYSQLKNAYQIQSLQALQKELEQQNKHSQAVEELANLQSTRNSWLYKLHMAIEELTLSEHPQPEAKAFIEKKSPQNDKMISIVEIDEVDVLGWDDLEKIIQDFMLLTQRQRAVLAEF